MPPATITPAGTSARPWPKTAVSDRTDDHETLVRIRQSLERCNGDAEVLVAHRRADGEEERFGTSARRPAPIRRA